MPHKAKLLSKRPPQFLFQVTQDLIDTAVKGNSNSCMVAESIKLRKPGASRVAVDIQTIRFTDNTKQERYVYLTPKTIQQAIVDFDAGKVIKPFTAKLGDGQAFESFHGKFAGVKRGAKKTKARKQSAKTRAQQLKKGHVPPKAIGSRRVFGLRSLAYGQIDAPKP